MTIKVTSSETVSFPKMAWGIHKGEVRELPEAKEMQDIILAHSAISKVEEKKPEINSNKA